LVFLARMNRLGQRQRICARRKTALLVSRDQLLSRRLAQGYLHTGAKLGLLSVQVRSAQSLTTVQSP
jgi:hypothetical protein